MLANHVAYGYGVKAPSLDCDSSVIRLIDCSGDSRYLIAKATNGQWIIPDGSQAQREYFENSGLHKIAKYSDVQYANPARLFICFIKPNTNGCGDVGHVWMVGQKATHGSIETIESHGGKGVDSRRWDTSVLVNQFYNGFEIPVATP